MPGRTDPDMLSHVVVGAPLSNVNIAFPVNVVAVSGFFSQSTGSDAITSLMIVVAWPSEAASTRSYKRPGSTGV